MTTEALEPEFPQTRVPAPRHRVFLPRSSRERWSDLAWCVVRTTLFRLSPPFLYRWRALLLRAFGARIDWSAKIEPSVRVEHPAHLTIGAGTSVAHKVVLDCIGEISIGAGTRISQYTHMVSGTHDYTRPDMLIQECPITIEDDVWIAADSFIGPGVTIARRAIVAARSSVFHDLEGDAIHAGEPASRRKARPADRT